MKIEYGKEYLYEDVKEIVRQRQLEILDAVVKICDNYNITYWLDGGTLLGAVRHQGFIPWDDDIDIGLMREDYEKLIKILPGELPEQFVVQSFDTDFKYKLPFVKIRDKYSVIEDNYTYNGIFIDIFPFDYMPKNKILQKTQYISMKVFEAAFVYTDADKLNIGCKKDLKSSIIKSFMKMASFFGFLLGNSGYNFFYKLLQKISELQHDDYIGDGLTASWAYFKSMRKIGVYLPTQKTKFCDKLYSVPNNLDVYLKSLYGDNYMTPIKFENAHINKVVFLDNK